MRVVTATGFMLLALAGCGSSSSQPVLSQTGPSAGYSTGHSAAANFSGEPADQRAQQQQQALGQSSVNTGTAEGSMFAIAIGYYQYSYPNLIELPTSDFAAATQICIDAQLATSGPENGDYTDSWNDGCAAGLEGR